MSNRYSRSLDLIGGADRRFVSNISTRSTLYDEPLSGVSFRDLFLRNYAEIRGKFSKFVQPGLAIVAVDAYRQNVRNAMYLGAKQDTANAAIIGRHSSVDLFLSDDESLSLRHLGVVISSLTATSGNLRFRVLDLRSSAAFHDEQGQTFEALVAEGSLFISCSGYALLFIAAGEDTYWPESAVDAWDCIPERVYVEGRAAEPEGRWPARRPPVGRRGRAYLDTGGPITRVTSVSGPVQAQRGRMVDEGEPVLGVLRISSPEGLIALQIGATAAERGILLGRDARCDVHRGSLLSDDGISRVHLLVLRLGEEMYAIDTGSTNGTQWIRKGQKVRDVRIAPLGMEDEFTLAKRLAEIHWLPAG